MAAGTEHCASLTLGQVWAAAWLGRRARGGLYAMIPIVQLPQRPGFLVSLVLAGCSGKAIIDGGGGAGGAATATGSDTGTSTETETNTGTSSGTGTGTLEECCRDPDEWCDTCFPSELETYVAYLEEMCRCGPDAPCVEACTFACSNPGATPTLGCVECEGDNADVCHYEVVEQCLADPACAPFWECLEYPGDIVEYCG